MKNILVLKASNTTDSKETALETFKERGLKVSAKRLMEVDNIILLLNNKVVQDFIFADKNIKYNTETQRVIDFKLADANNVTKLVGKEINYKTKNPVTISSLDNLEENIIK